MVFHENDQPVVALAPTILAVRGLVNAIPSAILPSLRIHGNRGDIPPQNNLAIRRHQIMIPEMEHGKVGASH
jgi:hypothetical protein